MADEQAQELAIPEVQPAVESAPVSEDAQTQQDETEHGDLRVALKQEREKRREIEAKLAQLDDPTFIYQKAREVGLVDEEETPTYTPPQTDDIQGQVRYALELEKAKDKYPDLNKSEEDQLMISALISKGLSPLQAADKFYARFEKAAESAKAVAAEEVRSELTAKEQAQTAQTGSTVSAASVELEQLQKDMKSQNPKTQKAAMLKFLEMQHKERGTVNKVN